MSDFESSNAESDGENPVTVEMFQCRKCPGKMFTAAEKDLHRQTHKDQKKDKDKDKDKYRRSTRNSSPAPSAATLFAPVPANRNPGTSPTPGTSGGPRQRSPPQQNGTKRVRVDDGNSPAADRRKKKIKSTKRTNEPVSFNTTTGG